MKSILVIATAVFSISALASDPASSFVNDTMVRGRQILEQKSDAARLQGICSLIKARVGYTNIGYTWLGDFNNLARERQAVQQFYRLVPSILISKVIQAGGNGSVDGGSFTVDPQSTPRGNGVFDVGLTVTTAKGSSYHGKIVVLNSGGKFKVIDAIYMGYSAVSYVGRDYQDRLRQVYNSDPSGSMPVTALIRSIMAEDGFTRCP